MCTGWKAILKRPYKGAVDFSSDRLCTNTYFTARSSAYEKLTKHLWYSFIWSLYHTHLWFFCDLVWGWHCSVSCLQFCEPCNIQCFWCMLHFWRSFVTSPQSHIMEWHFAGILHPVWSSFKLSFVTPLAEKQLTKDHSTTQLFFSMKPSLNTGVCLYICLKCHFTPSFFFPSLNDKLSIDLSLNLNLLSQFVLKTS